MARHRLESGGTTRERTNGRTMQPPGSATARELYWREKERRARRNRDADPLAEARRAYLALLEAEAGTARGGRPRKTAKRARAVIEQENEEALDGEPVGLDESEEPTDEARDEET